MPAKVGVSRAAEPSASVGDNDEGLVRGIESETNFAPIDATSDAAPGGVAGEERFGPEATLLMGFTSSETKEWREMLDAIGADFVKTLTLTTAMKKMTLGEAISSTQADASVEKSALGVPRMMFLSGMSGSEVMQIIDCYEDMFVDEKDWAPAIFACAVPRNWDSSITDLTAEIMDDHTRLTGAGRERGADCPIDNR